MVQRLGGAEVVWRVEVFGVSLSFGVKLGTLEIELI